MGIGDNTLVVFTSDSGPTHDVGGVDTKFFKSAAPLRGRKVSVFEGGLRVPTIARWTGRIKAGSASKLISAAEDWLPTFAALGQATLPVGTSGVDLSPTLFQQGEQEIRPYLSWEFFGYGGQQAVRMGKWKAVRQQLKKGGGKLMLFDLDEDIGEKIDVAHLHPKIAAKMDHIMRHDRTPNPTFPIPMLDAKEK